MGEITRTHNLSTSYIPDHRNRTFIVRGSESGKTNALLNVIYHQERFIHINTILLQKDVIKNLFICYGSIRTKISILN